MVFASFCFNTDYNEFCVRQGYFYSNPTSISYFSRLPKFSYESRPKLAPCILAKIAEFQYSRQKCYFSANRRWFLLVFDLTQTKINSLSDKAIFTQIRQVFPIFRDFRSSAMKASQNWPFAFWPKWVNFQYSRQKCYFSANRRWFLLVFVLTQITMNYVSDKAIFTQIRQVFPIFRGFRSSAMKAGQNWPLAFWPKMAEFQ